MLLRKSRQHLQGSSNRYLSNETLQSSGLLNKNLKGEIRPLITNLKNFQLSSKLSKNVLRNRQKNYRPQTQQRSIHKENHAQFAQKNIKGLYRQRHNVVKLIEAWGFNQKGQISAQQFIQKINQKIGKSLSEKQKESFLSKYANHQYKISISKLLTLIYSECEGVIMDNNIFEPHDRSQNRERLIVNLKQNLKGRCFRQKEQISQEAVNKLLTKINHSLSKLRNNEIPPENQKENFFEQLSSHTNFSNFQMKMLEKIKSHINFSSVIQNVKYNRKIDDFVADPLFRIVKKQSLMHQRSEFDSDTRGQIDSSNKNYERQSQCNSVDQIMKTALFNTQFQKKHWFQPELMKDVDQRKTRFGAQQKSQQSTGWRGGTSYEKVRPNQKQLILRDLQIERNNIKERKQLRIVRMKEWREKQKQNVNMRQQAAKQRQNSKLKSLKQQQQAYNYVNFIKKSWN